MSEEFAGLVIVAIAGNAVENVVGVQLAARNRPDFAISVIVNSSLQIALALTPVLDLHLALLHDAPDARVPDPARARGWCIAAILGALIVERRRIDVARRGRAGRLLRGDRRELLVGDLAPLRGAEDLQRFSSQTRARSTFGPGGASATDRLAAAS